MKKRFTILMTVALLLSLSGIVIASRLQQVSYTTGFQVANLSATEEAHIIIIYCPQDPDEECIEVGVGSGGIVPAGGSVTYAVIPPYLGDPFNGSVVVSSDQPIATIANTLGNFPSYAAATGGFSAGSTYISLPLVMCNNNGFDTWFNIQNAGLGDAAVTITYIPGSYGTAASDTATIGEGRALTFDQKAGSSGDTKKCGDGLGTTFVGGATITSDQPIVATVMQINESGFNVLMGYNGFTAGSDDIRAPLIMAANNGFYTGIQVQNVSDVDDCPVTISYGPNSVGDYAPPDDTCTLDAGSSRTYIQNVWTDRYVGSATMTTTPGCAIVAIVNQVLAGAVSYGTAYEAFNAADATTNVNTPLVMANNSGYYTGIQVQNVSSADDCAVTINYGPNGAGTYDPPDDICRLDAGESCTKIQNVWTEKYVGSASIVAACEIVAIVNEFGAGYAGDQFYTFDAFNY